MPDALYKPNFQGTTPQGPQGSLSHGTAQALAPAKLLHALVSQCVNARLGLNPQPSPAALPAEGQPLFLPKAPQIYEAAIENPMLGKLSAWLGWLSACPLSDFSFFPPPLLLQRNCAEDAMAGVVAPIPETSLQAQSISVAGKSWFGSQNSSCMQCGEWQSSLPGQVLGRSWQMPA